MNAFTPEGRPNYLYEQFNYDKAQRKVVKRVNDINFERWDQCEKLVSEGKLAEAEVLLKQVTVAVGPCGFGKTTGAVNHQAFDFFLRGGKLLIFMSPNNSCLPTKHVKILCDEKTSPLRGLCPIPFLLDLTTDNDDKKLFNENPIKFCEDINNLHDRPLLILCSDYSMARKDVEMLSMLNDYIDSLENFYEIICDEIHVLGASDDEMAREQNGRYPTKAKDEDGNIVLDDEGNAESTFLHKRYNLITSGKTCNRITLTATPPYEMTSDEYNTYVIANESESPENMVSCIGHLAEVNRIDVRNPSIVTETILSETRKMVEEYDFMNKWVKDKKREYSSNSMYPWDTTARKLLDDEIINKMVFLIQAMRDIESTFNFNSHSNVEKILKTLLEIGSIDSRVKILATHSSYGHRIWGKNERGKVEIIAKSKPTDDRGWIEALNDVTMELMIGVIIDRGAVGTDIPWIQRSLYLSDSTPTTSKHEPITKRPVQFNGRSARYNLAGLNPIDMNNFTIEDQDDGFYRRNKTYSTLPTGDYIKSDKQVTVKTYFDQVVEDIYDNHSVRPERLDALKNKDIRVVEQPIVKKLASSFNMDRSIDKESYNQLTFEEDGIPVIDMKKDSINLDDDSYYSELF